jgi:hypothetical protein
MWAALVRVRNHCGPSEARFLMCARNRRTRWPRCWAVARPSTSSTAVCRRRGRRSGQGRGHRAQHGDALRQEAIRDGRVEIYPPAMDPILLRRTRDVAVLISLTSTCLLLQRKNVPGHYLGVRGGYFRMRRHVPRAGAMDAFSDRCGENRDRLRIAPLPGGDIGVRRARFVFIVRVTDIALVLLQQDLRSLGAGNID